MLKVKTVLAVFACTALLTGCGSLNYTDAPPTLGVLYSKYAVLGYAEPQQKIEDVGIVTTDGLIQIQSVDGRPISTLKRYKVSGLYSGGRFQLHLLPGEHTLTMSFRDDRGNGTISWSTADLTKVITINKGQVIHLWLSRDGRTWDAKQADGAGALDVIVSDFNELANAK